MKKKERKNGLFKGILLFIVVAIVLSWLIPSGAFGTEYVGDGTLTRFGLNDVSWLVYYGISMGIDKILMLLAIGGFYGILSKTKAYESLVSSIAKKFKNKKIAVVLFSVIIAGLTSILSQVFVVLIFVPFIVAILKRMKLDKMTILATTFGSMLVGIMGATWGTEGLNYFAQTIISGEQAVQDVVNSMVLVRAGILLIGLILFNFFTLSHMDKVEDDEESTEMFPTEVNKEEKTTTVIPIVAVMFILFVLVILGHVNWNYFGIDVFDNFHNWLTEFHIGKDFYIFKGILGVRSAAFGTWDLFMMPPIILIFTVILGLCYKVKLDDFKDNYLDGIKKMGLPIACIIGAFMLLTAVYVSPYVVTIDNWLYSLTDGFNLATMSLSALITNIFHTDMYYTGYVMGTFLATEFVDYINPVFVIFTSLYGFVQLFIPTSIVLGVGLTSLKVKYTDWLKYIFKFIVGMLICLLVIFILMTLL